jgi:glyceraldehyde 3-phosphate dehydrogenase
MTATTSESDPHRSLAKDWSALEAAAETVVPLVGRLFRERGVVTAIYGRSLVHQPTRKIIKLHRFARHIDGQPLPVEQTVAILQHLINLRLNPATIDIAELHELHQSTPDASWDALLAELLATIIDPDESTTPPPTTDVVLYGFGRIGRLLARLMIANHGAPHGLRLRSIVVRQSSPDDLVKRASLLRRDTVHGPFDGTITVDPEKNTIIANGTVIQVINAGKPATIDYTALGIHDALLVDNTGRWRDRDGLSQHLSCPGINKVLLTAPGKGDLKNIVYGVNHNTITSEDSILSAASCTTNAITPVLKAINDRFGLVHGHVETVHSFTNDQNLTDNYHKGHRRGRSASLNMVIAETGAAKAVAKALPELAGKLTGSSVRIPTPNVSLAILNLTLASSVDRDQLNQHLRTTSLHSSLRRQIAYTDSPEVVSSDFLGTRHTGTVDGLATITDDTHAVVYVWYDNEYGYSCQVLRVMDHLAGTQRPVLPATEHNLNPA